jgi:putative nucleotidyltransferase with HDIG domain
MNNVREFGRRFRRPAPVRDDGLSISTSLSEFAYGTTQCGAPAREDPAVKSYSTPARLFIICICATGLACAAGSFLLPNAAASPASGLLYAVALVMAFAAGSRKVCIVQAARLRERCCISLGFFITVFCLVAFGPRAFVWAAIISGAGASLLPRRMARHQIAFNVASLAITACVSAAAYTLLDRGSAGWMHLPIVKTLTATGIYFIINSGLVAAVISLCAGRPLPPVWQSMLWTGPSYFAGASLALLVQHWAGTDVNLLLMVPVLAFILHSYQTYIDRLEESRRHLRERERDIEELKESRRALNALYDSTVNCLATAIDAKDRGTHAHIVRVQKLALGIAHAMNVEGAELEAVRTGAVLHDIGKLSVPDEILLKPGPLSDEEFGRMKLHTVVGAEMLEPVQFPWPVVAVVRHHHERWDGRGYPDALAGTDIPLSARIMAVADVYDALTSDRPYRAAWSSEAARQYVLDGVCRQFDPDVVDAFLRYLDGKVCA